MYKFSSESAVSNQLSVVNGQWSVVSGQLFAVRRGPQAIRGLAGQESTDN